MQIQTPLLSLLSQQHGAVKQLIAQMSPGDLIEAVVVKSSGSSNLISIRLVDTLLSISSPVQVEAGQKIVLQRVSEQGQAALKIIPPELLNLNKPQSNIPLSPSKAIPSAPSAVTASPVISANITKLGDVIPVEVKQVESEKTVLVKSRLNNDDRTFEVDVSRINHRFKLGEKVALEVLSESPLQLRIKSEDNPPSKPIESLVNKLQTLLKDSREQITAKPVIDTPVINPKPSEPVMAARAEQLQPKATLDSTKSQNVEQALAKASPLRYQYINNKVQELLLLQADKPKLDTVLTLLDKNRLPATLKVVVEQIIKNTINTSEITDAKLLKQAIVTSGLMTEHNIRIKPELLTQDLKANIMKIVETLSSLIRHEQVEGKDDVKAAINRLPHQALISLASSGKTPAQLLSLLLSPTERIALPSITNVLTPVLTSSEQAAVIGRTLIASSNQVLAPYELQALFKDVEQLQSKIQLNQLLSLKESESSSSQTSWLFDLPIKDKQSLDFVQLQVAQDKQEASDNNEEDTWQVKLRLDTAQLGPLKAMITFTGLDVDIVLTAQDKNSAGLLDEHINTLEQALKRLGVNVQTTRCEYGVVEPNIATTVAREKQPISDSKVDISV